MIMANAIIMWLYYGIVLFFMGAILHNFIKSTNVQDIILYGIVLLPFVLRIARLK
ncbi:hypothetical protein [Acetomicrobium sp.]|jgi:hypothetical protein|uniref:hypothetical protein n=1 Tax=Acetomicrobium sp. TaxID=1872099 RepID=UPI0028723432|nr:hypothetical protein [Acetomicrobium sp.]MDR9769984.1 hypothetical protein [Acetomicrobium sp.]HPT64377.1 hypothetical protein [Acetomicrobium sp.]HXK98452.1 hypothetical protein [Acetomicrobium sp.]